MQHTQGCVCVCGQVLSTWRTEIVSLVHTWERMWDGHVRRTQQQQSGSANRISPLAVSRASAQLRCCSRCYRSGERVRSIRGGEHARGAARSSTDVPKKRRWARTTTRARRGEEEGLLGHSDQPRSVHTAVLWFKAQVVHAAAAAAAGQG